MIATVTGVDPAPWSASSIDPLRQRFPLDHRWFPFLQRLQRWLADPESAVINDDDIPLTDAVVAHALESALRLYASGVAAPTGVAPDCDGAIVFEKHDGDPNPEGKPWEHRTVRFLADGAVELLLFNSEGVAERRILSA